MPAVKRRERDRRRAAERKRAHGELANPILEQGTTIKTEKLSYQSFQRNFGRSVKLRAPGMLVSTLRCKAEGAGGGVIEIDTRQTRLSQFNHTTGEYIKKPLSQRTHVFGDGATAPVQRDLYSAFLATCRDTLHVLGGGIAFVAITSFEVRRDEPSSCLAGLFTERRLLALLLLVRD